MLLRKGNIYRNVSEKEAALLIQQGYIEVKEPEKVKKETKPKAKG